MEFAVNEKNCSVENLYLRSVRKSSVAIVIVTPLSPKGEGSPRGAPPDSLRWKMVSINLLAQ